MPVKRGKDFKGPFYSWGHQKKYYFNPNSERSRKRAKLKAIIQGAAIKESEMRGKGIVDNVKRFLGFKYDSPQLNNLLKNHGNEIITRLVVGRQPLSSNLTKALNVVTFGGLRKVPYDKLFHLYLMISTNNGRQHNVEKNEVIRVASTIGSGEKETISVPIGKQITLMDFFNNGIRVVGSKHFFTYKAFSWNCQDFVANCLLAPNGLITPSINSFIMQDTQKILEHLPFFAERAANAATDLAAGARHFLGQGIRPGGFRIDVPKTVLA